MPPDFRNFSPGLYVPGSSERQMYTTPCNSHTRGQSQEGKGNWWKTVGTTKSTELWFEDPGLRNQSKARGLARWNRAVFSSLWSGGQRTEAGEHCRQGVNQAFGVKVENLPDTKESKTPSWERKYDRLAWGLGEQCCSAAIRLCFPRGLSSQSHHAGQASASSGGHPILLPISWVNKVAHEGIRIVGQGGEAPKSVLSFENWGTATSL